MGNSLGREVAHYRGQIRSGDHVIIASNNLCHGLSNKITKTPFYASYIDSSTKNVVMVPMDIIEKSNLYKPLIFQINLSDNGFTLKLVSTNTSYVCHDDITYQTILTNDPVMLKAITPTNAKSLTSWKDSVLSDVGYIIQDKYSGITLEWSWTTDTKDIELMDKHQTYNQIRFIPLTAYNKITGEIQCNNIISDECINKILHNEKRWINNKFSQKTDSYESYFTDYKDYENGFWYEYAPEPITCSGKYKGPCPEGYNSQYLNEEYKCVADNYEPKTGVTNSGKAITVIIGFIVIILLFIYLGPQLK